MLTILMDNFFKMLFRSLQECCPVAQKVVRSWRGIMLFPVLSIIFLGRGDTLAEGFDTSLDTWGVLGGYGQSIPGWGLTTQRVETIDLVPRYDHVIFDHIGSGIVEGRYSTMIEIPFHIVIEPERSAMLGLNVLARYSFIASESWQPYIFGGGGPVYSCGDVPGMGAEWNGNYQFGVGLDHRIDQGKFLFFEIRYHHISNGGHEEPNDPLNSIKVLTGIAF